MNKTDMKEWLNRLYNITRIPCRVYEKSGMELYDIQNEEFQETGKKYVQQILEQLEKETVVILSLEKETELPLIWAGLKETEHYYLLGPVAYAPLDKGQIRKYHSLIIKRDPAYCRREVIFSELSILLEVLTGLQKDINFFEQFLQNQTEQNTDKLLTEEKIKQIDSFQLNHTMDEETFILDFIREGDTDGIRDYLSKHQIAAPVVCRDVKKNQEYMAVVCVSLMARAAASSGVTSQESFLLNDVYLKRISEGNSIADLKKITRDAAIDFAEMVRRNRQCTEQSPVVTACKKYIISHRMEKITLSNIADYLEISPSHLCRVFKAQEGMTVASYIMKEKIAMACNLLKYSDRFVNEISDYLNFDSVSYFSRYFKKATGMSPNQYRKMYRKMDF